MKDWRMYFVFFLILVAGVGIGARMFYLQILKGGYYSAFVLGQHGDFAETIPPRGEIFFQNRFDPSRRPGGEGLSVAATNKNWSLIYAVPHEIEDADIASAKLASFLYKEGEEEIVLQNEIYEKIKDSANSYKLIANKLDEDIAKAIENLELQGIYIKEEKLRYYPASELASHAIGFLGYRGNERVGQYGVEGFYDEGYLADGKSLELTIDYNIQFVLQEKLEEAKARLDADSASGIVMDPATGEIIALVVIDEFDPNNYSKVDSIDVFLNDITQKMFEPGSVFKPFTLASAMEIGRISPRTKYEDFGSIKIGKYTIRNSDEKAYGKQTMANVLELSLNTGAVFAQNLLGQDNFRSFIKLFGFGEKTGVDLQGEVGGDIRNILYTSRDINFATASFGQGIAVTPMQLVTAFSAFANGGKIMKPHVVDTINSKDSDSVKIEPEIIAEPISAKTAAQMTAMLVSVVDNGHGRKAKVPGYKVAGKTGTAQVPKEGGRGYSEKTIHSFIGYAPAYNPRFLALLKLDNPKDINFSADTVAPLFSEIAEYILNYYEIPPDS